MLFFSSLTDKSSLLQITCFFCLVFFIREGKSQNESTYTITSTVLDAQTNKPLAFATIYNTLQASGTASNANGYFELPNNLKGDTLVISYLGYKDNRIIVSDKNPVEIRLNPELTLLDEIIVTAKSKFLFDLINRVRKNKTTSSKTAKTYFYLESTLNNNTLEILEAYYNGEYVDHRLNQLDLKKGRIGLRPYENRYFMSTESSKLYSMHDIFTKSLLFPDNPLTCSKRELRKKYRLQLKQRYDDNGRSVVVVSFVPRGDRQDLFYGECWVAIEDAHLLKIHLKTEHARRHPFVPIGKNEIQNVSIDINRTFDQIDGESFINSSVFNYSINYTDKRGHSVFVNTESFTKAYDYQDSFQLPYFEFSENLHTDYRNITAVPYDSVFWNYSSEFKFYDRMKRTEEFILNNRIEKELNTYPRKPQYYKPGLQYPLVIWSLNRIRIKESDPQTIEESRKYPNTESDRYRFAVKLYLDYHWIGDSIIYQIYSIIDPVNTFYHFNINNLDLAFINMYFDLMEVQKRALSRRLDQLHAPTDRQIHDLYQQHVLQFEQTSRKYLEEVHLGKHLQQMEAWNAHIVQHLGVDNLSLFGLLQE